MPALRQLYNLTLRQQVLLERLKTHEARNIIKGLNEIDKGTVEILAALSTDVGQLTKKELLLTLHKLAEANTQATEKAAERLKDRLGEYADYSAELESKSIEVVAPSLRIAYPKKGIAYARALARPMSIDGGLLEPFIDEWGKSEVLKINNLVRKGWAEGWTGQQMIQAVRGTRAQNFQDGIVATTRRNAEAVVRTGFQHVANSARMATWEENDDIIVAYIFVATLDNRTSQICRSLDRQEFKLNQGPVPPMHIRCRSTTVAVLDPALGLGFLKKGATRSSEFGYVDANETYYDWLKKQPATFQDEAIGKTRGKLFRDGGLSTDQFAKLNLNKNFEPLTLDEMRKVAPSVFERAGLDN